ncbi:hypothetical protein [Kitasatospora cineracea]|uniref:Uncharacterized protein n=1 Tax=Kitasatospora cineracea TaxID=88074 RepID=A0A8G1XAF1_9ACTN|nr:hypothetical protein [Kitasatospora cineracea]ROR42529.1 hypothetical protein EDD39_0651 [Kitasatospora cineracea]
MNEDEWLERHGLHPAAGQLDEVRRLLREQTDAERRTQGAGDTALMKLCCVQLFTAAVPDDVLLIWQAKTAGMDADASIEIQLLCGCGLVPTKDHLAADPSAPARAALRRLLASEEAGDFEGFSVARQTAAYSSYYA